MNQVHKENLEHVENALPNRQGLEVEIFGMEGIPQEVLEGHRNRLVQNFYQAQEDRRLATGNPLPGQPKNQRKKIKVETAEELKRRVADWRAKRKAGVSMEGVVPSDVSCSLSLAVIAALLDRDSALRTDDAKIRRIHNISSRSNTQATRNNRRPASSPTATRQTLLRRPGYPSDPPMCPVAATISTI